MYLAFMYLLQEPASEQNLLFDPSSSFVSSRRGFTRCRSAGLITWESQGGPREGPESEPIGGAKDHYTKDLGWMVQTDRRGLLC